MGEFKIGFTGDVAFSRYYKERFAQKNLVDKELISFLNSSNYNVFNIEGAMCTPTRQGVFAHGNPPESIPLLAAMKPSIWNLANNHMMDAGAEGCEETLRQASKNGYMTIGAGINEADAFKPVILPDAGGIGIFGMTYISHNSSATDDTAGCADWDRMPLIRETVKTIKNKCRWCIAVIHGGREFCDIPMQDIRDRYHRYLKAGVDIIVAHHPHVPQNYERVGDKLIFYSLGNFIFDTDYQRAQFHTDTGILLKLFLTKTTASFEAVGTLIDRSTGIIHKSELPAVFTEFTDKDYASVYPLAAKRFKEHEIRRILFLHPDDYPDKNSEETFTKILDLELQKRPTFDLVMKEADRFDGMPLAPEYEKLQEYLI